MSRSLRKKAESRHPSNRTGSNCGSSRCAGFIFVAYISAALLLLLSLLLLPDVVKLTNLCPLTATLPTPVDVYHQAHVAWARAADEALRYIYPSDDGGDSLGQLVVHDQGTARPQSVSNLVTVEAAPASIADAPDSAASDAASASVRPSATCIASAGVGDTATAAAETPAQSALRNDDRALSFSGAPAVIVITEKATETQAMRSDDVPTAYVGFAKWGRLGNRMFQYASGLALALRYDRPAVLVLPDEFAERSMDAMRSIFRLSELPTLYERPLLPAASDLLESGWGRYDAVRFDNASTFERSFYTVGYFQSWRYFEPVADRVRHEFALTAHAAQAADSYFRSLGLPLQSDDSDRRRGDGEAQYVRVGVHVRRGDMLHKADEYTVAPAEYLLKAIAYYCHKYAAPRYNVSFVFATDDRTWVLDFVASLLPDDVTVHLVNLDISGDMAVLSRCDHSIVTSGTFGWWAAWLAGGDVVYYSDFIRPESELYSGHEPDDYYPPNWLGMTA